MTNTEALQALYRRIPELQGGWKTIMLPRHYWTSLSDLEFTILYTLPNLKIKVTNRTMEYIEQRRAGLRLPKQYTKVIN